MVESSETPTRASVAKIRERPSSHAPEPIDARRESLGLAVVNLLLLIGFGLALSGWCLYYTDFFPMVGGLPRPRRVLRLDRLRLPSLDR